MVQYTTAKGRPRLEILTQDILPCLPADFYSRQLCISTFFEQAVVAAVSMYNPNTGLGSIAVRSLDWTNEGESVISAKAAAAAPIGKYSQGSNYSSTLSPTTTDRKAIHDCVQAPPPSVARGSLSSAQSDMLVTSKSSFMSSSAPSKASPTGLQLVFPDADSMMTPQQPLKKKKKALHTREALPPKPTTATPDSAKVSGTTSIQAFPSSQTAQVSPEQKESTTTPSAESTQIPKGPITKYLQKRKEKDLQPKATIKSNVRKTTPELDSPKAMADNTSGATLASPTVPRKKKKEDEKMQPIKKDVSKAKRSKLTMNDTLSAKRVLETEQSRHAQLDECATVTSPTNVAAASAASLHVAANMLVGLKSPSADTGVVSLLPSKFGKGPKTVASESKRKRSLSPLQRSLSRQELESSLEEVLIVQYKRLKVLLDGLPKSNVVSRMNIPKPSHDDLHAVQENERARLGREHQASHELIRKRLLRAAEGTLRSLVNFSISTEEAKGDLKDTIQSYQELLVSQDFVFSVSRVFSFG
jgi:hypothetical protein